MVLSLLAFVVQGVNLWLGLRAYRREAAKAKEVEALRKAREALRKEREALEREMALKKGEKAL